jgi:hypothetical protein
MDKWTNGKMEKKEQTNKPTNEQTINKQAKQIRK